MIVGRVGRVGRRAGGEKKGSGWRGEVRTKSMRGVSR
jgi:hypothetical protein